MSTDDAGYCGECGGCIDSGGCVDPCEHGLCSHNAHCDGCGAGMEAATESGCCAKCDAAWYAIHSTEEIGRS